MTFYTYIISAARAIEKEFASYDAAFTSCNKLSAIPHQEKILFIISEVELNDRTIAALQIDCILKPVTR